MTVLVIIGAALAIIVIYIAIIIVRVIFFPKTSLHYNIKGGVAWKFKKYDEAIEHYRKAIQLNPDDENAHLYMGSSYVETGKYDEAIKSFQKVIELKPFYANTYCLLGLVYKKSGNQVKADEYFQKYKKIFEKN